MTHAHGPLEGVRVLELGSSVAGPFCGRLLADFGAEVIKVEVAEGDPLRSMSKRFQGHSLYAASILRNKRLISIDLRTAEGRALARALADKCDVVLENFRPGTLEKWGLSYEELSRTNPGLVMVRISGFGQTGPYSQRAGYGAIGEAVSGLRHLTGDPDRPPARVAASITDEVTALYAAFGALLALRARAHTGRGQQVDAALYEAAFSLIEPHVPVFDKLGIVANRAGSRLPDSAPNNLYVSRDQRYIHVTAMGDAVFERLAQAMGRPDLVTDSRFTTQTDRSDHEDALDALISDWVGSHELSVIESKLEEFGVPAARIYDVRDIFGDKHFYARNMLVKLVDPDMGEVTVPGVVPKLSETPGKLHFPGRRVGADTASVIKELLELDDSEIQQLADSGVIYCSEPSHEGATQNEV